nr:AAA domain-containing protein [uncultured Pseudodesulfovibrio sp.]
MALLHFANITNHRPEILMSKTAYGLNLFRQFLLKVKNHQESTDNVKHLAWEQINKPTNTENTKTAPDESQGVWIQLKNPDISDSEMETALRHFLDESVDTIYEADHANWKAVGTPATECSHCKKMSYATEEHAWEIAISCRKDLNVYECPKGNGWHLTGRHHSAVPFRRDNALTILDRSADEEQLKLDRLPQLPYIVIRPNTYQLRCQLDAIDKLKDAPDSHHYPLLRLFEASNHAKWPEITIGSDQLYFADAFNRYLSSKPEPHHVKEWEVLTDENRPGNNEQRTFVKKALNTPDFAFLEGPPGSGKTTAVCELVLQLIKQGKRILLCASTHVAVDNVLERLMAKTNPLRSSIIPIRIGDRSSISKKVRPWELREFVKTETKRLINGLQKEANPSPAQKEMLRQLRHGKGTIQKTVLTASNLVCGTTIGILQHPEIKAKGQSPTFDVMIIDEASKTTFQEFLVPALLAKRWILVGDPKQLSPYVDDEATAVNIAPSLPQQYKRDACIDVFRAMQSDPKFRFCSIVATDNEEEQLFYIKQALKNEVRLWCEGNDPEELPYASMIVASPQFLRDNVKRLPLDISFLRTPEKMPSAICRRVASYNSTKSRSHVKEAPSWENEIAWRRARHYEQRKEIGRSFHLSEKKLTGEKLAKQLEALLPAEDTSVSTSINSVSRIAFPSILESLQEGFQREDEQRDPTALSDGIPKGALEQRQVLLTYQHRMHPEIAQFPHETIYSERALLSSPEMERKREWAYKPGRRRIVWNDVKGIVNRKGNYNPGEAQEAIQELKDFDSWTARNPKHDGGPWQVAALSFYRGQEQEIQRQMQKWTQTKNRRHFHRGKKEAPYLEIEVCTVDRFQGHEADLVLLSFMNDHPTSFLQSPNRLNVALTRARYQLVVFGNRQKMKKASGVLGAFAQEQHWGVAL